MVFISITVLADGFIASVGGDYSKSDYGSSESTNVFYMTFTASYETGAFTYGLTAPWIRVSGLGNIVPSGFGISGSGAGGGDGSIGAFGCASDSRKGASKPADSGSCAGVTNSASASYGLGSGKTDYSVQANVDKYFGAPYVSVGLGYKWLGEPSGVSYDNVVSAH